MLRFFIFIYGLSLTEAYTIKVSGKVELGNQLSKLFKELYSQLAENGGFTSDFGPNGRENGYDTSFQISPNSPEVQHINGQSEIDVNDASNEKKPKRHKKRREEFNQGIQQEEAKDIPVLDKMMQNGLEKLHLYGYHKIPQKKSGEPLNNVNL